MNKAWDELGNNFKRKGGSFIARDTRVSIKVEQDMKFKLQDTAQKYGLTISALGAYIIGQWMSNYGSNKPEGLPPAADNHEPGVPV